MVAWSNAGMAMLTIRWNVFPQLPSGPIVNQTMPVEVKRPVGDSWVTLDFCGVMGRFGPKFRRAGDNVKRTGPGELHLFPFVGLCRR